MAQKAQGSILLAHLAATIRTSGQLANLGQGGRYSRGFDEQLLSLLQLPLQSLYFHLKLNVLPDMIKKRETV